MQNLKTIAKKSVLWLVAAALLVTVTVVLWNPAPNADAPQTDAAGNEGVVSGDGVVGDNAQLSADQLPPEDAEETVEINQGTDTDTNNVSMLPIKEKLTWEAINSFPIKYADMPIAERRQLVVDFFNFSKAALWTPKEDLAYDGGTLKQGTIYGGIPYVTLSSGNVYRLMDFIDESTGVLDVAKYMAEPPVDGVYSSSAMKYFGGQCTYTTYWGWARVMNSAEYSITYNNVPKNGFILVGDYTGCGLDTLENWKSQNSSCSPSAPCKDGCSCCNSIIDNTPEVLAKMSNVTPPTTSGQNKSTLQAVNDSARQPMYQNYKNLKKGDGMMYVTTGGHFLMCTSDAHVEYNTDGTINDTNSYILVSDQAGDWPEGISAQGDWFLYQTGIDTKMTFEELFNKAYITFTFAEFQEGDILEETEVSFSHTGSTITKSQLFASTVTTNYSFADVYVIVTNDQGQEVYRHIVRAGGPSVREIAIVESAANVDTLGTLTSGTYNIEIVAQLGTGERPTVYTGTLKV